MKDFLQFDFEWFRYKNIVENRLVQLEVKLRIVTQKIKQRFHMFPIVYIPENEASYEHAWKFRQRWIEF